MESSPLFTNVAQNQDSYSFKDLWHKGQDFWEEIRKNWRIILAFCLPTLLWQSYIYIKTPIIYPAHLTFMLNDDEGGRFGGLAGFLGGLGFSNSREANLEKIVELSKSSRIVSTTLMKEVEIDGKKDLLANHFIRIQKIQEDYWSKPNLEGATPLKGFLFQKSDSNRFDRNEMAALKTLSILITGDESGQSLLSSSFNRRSAIMNMGFESRSEALTIAFLRTLFDNLSGFYIEKAIEKNKATYDFIHSKSDSLKALLEGKEYSSARFEDQNTALMLSTDRLPSQRLYREKLLISAMYAESLKNLEVADFALRNSTPFIQPIDLPVAPLESRSPSKKKALLFGIGLGLALGVGFVLLRKIWRESMSQ